MSTRAAAFGARFAAKDWTALAGRWHDLGKYAHEFQAYLLTQNGFEAHLETTSRVDHSTAGAQHAAQSLGPAGQILAYCIAGHHGGLPDATGGGAAAALDQRLDKNIPDWSTAPSALLAADTPLLPNLSFDRTDPRRAAYQLSFFCRLVFSALVDADFPATEAFMNPVRSAQRPQTDISIAQLAAVLDRHVNALAAGAATSTTAGTVTVRRCRQEVWEACGAAAPLAPGLFSLAAPTGSGKTLSSLSFALRHAATHGLDRVIYAIPFTSIVEQTADVIRRVFASLTPAPESLVVEHHSHLEPTLETPQSRLAAENWDAPVVVTTNVQFFESLFAARPSRCRKLHRIAGSVVILDEVQTLPVDLLRPCLAVLRELAADYRCTIVLCTATQPAIEWRPEFPIGLRRVRPIIPDPTALATRMRRVDLDHLGPLSDADLCLRLAGHDQFLCIVNTRPHARRLFERLQAHAGRSGAFHLSTLMCAAHRSETLRTIRDRLAQDLPCRVISTQLIEAGVDVDFPVVYRAVTGVDAIAQAAGRCNREGTRARGQVYLFDPPAVHLRGLLASTAASTREVLATVTDVLSPDAVDQYCRLHYWKHQGDTPQSWDLPGVMAHFGRDPEKFQFQFRRAADGFRLIDNPGISVVVPWTATAQRLMEEVRRSDYSRALYRQLQRYHVRVFPHMLTSLGDAIETCPDGTNLLVTPTCYDDDIGLRCDRTDFHEPEALII